MINKYKLKEGDEFICYGMNIEMPEGITLIEKDIDPSKEENLDLPILSYYDFAYKSFYGKRTDEMRLSEAGISTFRGFMLAHFLNMQKQLNKPAKIRKLVEERYAEIIAHLPEIENKENE